MNLKKDDTNGEIIAFAMGCWLFGRVFLESLKYCYVGDQNPPL